MEKNSGDDGKANNVNNRHAQNTNRGLVYANAFEGMNYEQERESYKIEKLRNSPDSNVRNVSRNRNPR